ncbi:hypothetical protein JKA74_09385 [Marivirga sp. S37H4]|uniref:Lipoprotein n=1 Tax=Marivirga aurantiaca TaxID=2802615 RepID=A0A934WYH4_9BACT|nr:hypothetical protein [Marivirga aurantiaca]MBK6265251.1 hypothetical protein [Marivirga aurantiaca]
MRAIILVFHLFLAIISSCGQTTQNEKPPLSKNPKTLVPEVPKNSSDKINSKVQVYEILPRELNLEYVKKADINLDGYTDAIVVCSRKDSLNSTRPVVIFYGNSEGDYDYIERNDHIICDGFQKIVVTKNYFTFESRIGTKMDYSLIYKTFIVKEDSIYFHRYDEEIYSVYDYDKGGKLDEKITKRAEEYDYPSFKEYK